MNNFDNCPLLMSRETKAKCSGQAPKSEALPEPTPGVCFLSAVPPASGWGLRTSFFGESIAKVLRMSRQKSKKMKRDEESRSRSHQEPPVLRKVSAMLAASSQGYEEVSHDKLM